MKPELVNPNMARTFAPPVMEARRWLEGVEFAPERPLINVSQAAPMAPPPEGLRRAIAEAAMEDAGAHLYGPVLGLPELREEIAAQWSEAYGGAVSPGQVAVTSGCNQAFAAAMATLAGPGDEVLLPVPWYFNHKMWLDMSGVRAVPVETDAGLLPVVSRIAERITARTRALVLVSPNNPGGVEYPAELVGALFELARERGITLVLDETYRDFDSRAGRLHGLFEVPGWDEVLVHLYSFSKAYRLTGHRVGAMVASAARLEQVEKFLDTVTICPNQLGQRAALWGMRNLRQWLGGERAETLARRAAVEAGFAGLEGWRLLGAGAFFAYAEHPFAMGSEELARAMVREAGVLALPGTMFMPEGAAAGARQMRFAFANVDVRGLGEMFGRLAGLDLPRAGDLWGPEGA